MHLRDLSCREQGENLPVVGEFTGAQTDCTVRPEASLMQGTKYLNGYGIGCRYEGQIDGAVRRGIFDMPMKDLAWKL